MEKEKDRGNIVLVILMIILVLLMCGAFVGMFFMMKEAENLRSEINELKEEKETVSDEKEMVESTKCKSIVGAYYAEVIDTNLHMKQTYSFSADGTYITYVENGGATNGTYVLKDGVINFTQKIELGPENETVTYSRTVSDDCKTIYVNEESLKYELKRIAE